MDRVAKLRAMVAFHQQANDALARTLHREDGFDPLAIRLDVLRRLRARAMACRTRNEILAMIDAATRETLGVRELAPAPPPTKARAS